jgi:hypothetical protein
MKNNYAIAVVFTMFLTISGWLGAFTCTEYCDNTLTPGWGGDLTVWGGIDNISYSGSDNALIASLGGYWEEQIRLTATDLFNVYYDYWDNSVVYKTNTANSAAALHGFGSYWYTGYTGMFLDGTFGLFSATSNF